MVGVQPSSLRRGRIDGDSFDLARAAAVELRARRWFRRGGPSPLSEAGFGRPVRELEDREGFWPSRGDQAFDIGAGGGEDGVDQVVDVDEVAGLGAVAEDGRVPPAIRSSPKIATAPAFTLRDTGEGRGHWRSGGRPS